MTWGIKRLADEYVWASGERLDVQIPLELGQRGGYQSIIQGYQGFKLAIFGLIASGTQRLKDFIGIDSKMNQRNDKLSGHSGHSGLSGHEMLAQMEQPKRAIFTWTLGSEAVKEIRGIPGAKVSR